MDEQDFGNTHRIILHTLCIHGIILEQGGDVPELLT